MPLGLAMELPNIAAPVIPPLGPLPQIPAIQVVEAAPNPFDGLAALVGEPMNAATRRRIEAEQVRLQAMGVLNGQIAINAGGCMTNTLTWGAWNITYTTNTAYTQTATMTMANTGNTAVTNTAVWNEWNGVYTLTTGCNNATTATIFTGGTNDWTMPAVTVTQMVNNAAWTVWNDRYTTIVEAGAQAEQIRRYSRRNLTEAELVAALEQEKQQREAAEKRAKDAQMAQQRAEQLLMTCLSAKQKDDLKTKNCFYVEIPSTDGKVERYRIDRGTHGNVKQIDEKGSIIRSFCIQPEGVPVADSMLTQKLFLEADEETRAKFWETANITDLAPAKKIPYNIPRQQRRQYAQQHGLLH